MTTWDPLPPVTPELPVKGGKFIDIEIFGGISLGGDIISANWDGTTPLNLASADAGATAGFALDSSQGAIQVQKLFAEGGEIGNLDIVNTLTLQTGGSIRSAASGQRIEITSEDTDRIRFFSGDNFEAVSAVVRSAIPGTDGTTRQLGISLFAPATTGDTAAVAMQLLSESEDDSSLPPQILIQYGGGSSQTPEFKLGNGFKLMLDDGSESAPSLTFNNDVKSGMYRISSNFLGWATNGAVAMSLASDKILRMKGSGIKYEGTNGSGASNSIGLKWGSPNIWGRVDNSIEAILGVVSDPRLKDDIQYIDSADGLARIGTLRPISYLPIDLDGTVGSVRQAGLNAKEVDKVEPWLVGHNDEDRAVSVNYLGIISLLVAAIQELEGRLNNLEREKLI